MTTPKPYIIRAYYEWIIDSGNTPYILVNTKFPGCFVPQEHVKDNKIVFNITHDVVNGLVLGNDAIEFKARFSGVPKQIYLPMGSIISIYAKETGEGTGFPEEDFPSEETTPKRTKPNLKIVD
jgi:stringent starvation protein B